jgi:hypothetical protein
LPNKVTSYHLESTTICGTNGSSLIVLSLSKERNLYDDCSTNHSALDLRGTVHTTTSILRRVYLVGDVCLLCRHYARSSGYFVYARWSNTTYSLAILVLDVKEGRPCMGRPSFFVSMKLENKMRDSSTRSSR